MQDMDHFPIQISGVADTAGIASNGVRTWQASEDGASGGEESDKLAPTQDDPSCEFIRETVREVQQDSALTVWTEIGEFLDEIADAGFGEFSMRAHYLARRLTAL